MKGWETIIDYVVPETVMNVSLTRDLNGNPFNLKELSVLVISMPGENTDSYPISVSPTKNREKPIGLLASCKNTDTKSAALIHYANCGFGLIPSVSAKSINTTNVWMELGEFLMSNSFVSLNPQTEVIENPDTCDGLWVGSHYQMAMTAGTRIIVRGIRC